MPPTEIRIVPAADRYRGGDPDAGIDTRHAFSFGAFYDPDNLRFGQLTACNEERLAPGAGFPSHPHRDLEIVSWVIEGELTHEDDTGTRTVVRPGDLQRLTAGSGVRHSERNAGPGPLRFAQMWLVPDEPGGPPTYEVVRGLPAGTEYRLPRTAAGLRLLRLAAGESRPLPAAPLRHLQLVAGAGRLAGRPVGAGDSVRLTGADGPPTTLTATADAPVEALLWTLAD
ncbi:pirin family protein [Streptomyces sp. DSM 44915]|uniref:Pirin family protein n=1 Tax=Streptomyces chisholmiae TaxID=3075540 RepID=A0ABU2JP63_9ACTN|nr:pirin family protein [Streptomyces sp. DSM 44915]MDT0266785.1 pirin family protein [Streptomyces sp. DSM 44915]